MSDASQIKRRVPCSVFVVVVGMGVWLRLLASAASQRPLSESFCCAPTVPPCAQLGPDPRHQRPRASQASCCWAASSSSRAMILSRSSPQSPPTTHDPRTYSTFPPNKSASCMSRVDHVPVYKGVVGSIVAWHAAAGGKEDATRVRPNSKGPRLHACSRSIDRRLDLVVPTR